MDNPTTTLADINTPGKALMLKALLDEYDVDVIRNAQQVRSYIKLKLLEMTADGNPKIELKALEMLGKMSDVGAFAERVEINVTHRTTEELENELANKLSQYLGDIIDVEAKNVTSMDVVSKAPAVQVIDIDAELGFVGGELVEDGQENDSTE
jgi:sugar-specific transcriptional regulator TrmB